MSNTSNGELAGIISAVVVGIVAVGKGVQWLAAWLGKRNDARDDRRSTKLQVWHDELQRREQDFDTKLDQRLSKLETQNEQRATENTALRMAFELVASALRAIDPRNTALSRAEQLLQTAFPLMPIVPPDMVADLKVVDRKDLAATAAHRTMEGQV